MASSRRARGGADQKAKERRQKLMVAAGGVLLLLLLAIQLPKVLSRGGGSSSSATPATPATTVALPETNPVPATKAYRAALKQPPHDVFNVRQLSGENTLGAVATPAGLHDPFAKPHSAQAAVAPAAQKPVSASPLPGTIVVGTPGAGKVTVQGWIVILASIPAAQGQSAATSFAAQARKAGFGGVSVLNSSTKKSLRGGYWVVYAGPFNTLGEVSTAADTIHGAGFKTAYIRQLVQYKAKPKAPATKTTKKKTTKK